MHEQELRHLIEDVREGRLPRRAFILQMVGLGLSAPMASMLLMHAGVAQAQTPSAYKPTKRGGGGTLKALWWQGATLLQPHFANGTKDQEGSRIFYEPLGSWDNDGNLVPILAAEVPTRENGGVAADGRSVTWKLKRGVTWHDGQPFTADDCVFTWEYAKDPATAAVTSGVFKDVKVDKIDSHTIRVTFPKPTPFWATAFCAAEGMIIPKHLFAPYIGAKSREAPTNLKPVGTGPYKFVDFKPGDMVRGRDQSELPHAQPPLLRRDRDEGRRRRRLGRARGAADRRVRLRVEPAGRGRGAEAHGGRRQGPRPHRPQRRHRVRPAERHRPLERGRRRARQRQVEALRVQRAAGAPGDGACWPTARACRTSSTAAPAWRRATS